jgi:hypothetical protein
VIITFRSVILNRVDHLIEGHDYNFRVRAVNKQGESLPLTSQSSVTAKDPFNKPDKPGTPELEGRPTLWTIFWLHKENLSILCHAVYSL